jgi:RNA polymerase sigma-70 factor (ECF subfamily)
LERELVEAARRGDRAAFDVLVRRKVESVYRTARTILGNDPDAEDATQEAFVAAWRHLPRLHDPERFDAWLGRITVNTCRMALRRRKVVREIRIEVGGTFDVNGDRLGHPGADGRRLDDEAIDAIAFDRAFDRLSIDDRAILTLHHADDLGLDEVARVLGIPAGTVKSRLLRARRALERSLERERPV